jgi:hypothetical protein
MNPGAARGAGLFMRNIKSSMRRFCRRCRLERFLREAERGAVPVRLQSDNVAHVRSVP